MRSMTQNWAYRAKIEETETSTRNVIEQCLAKPAKMLFLEPILLFMSLYISVVFGECISLTFAWHLSTDISQD
jgi:hypothetical protein